MSAAGKATFNDQVVIGDGKLVLNSTAVTSTAAELNLLDGVSGLVQADLTKLAAIDATAAELNIVDGDTSASTVTIVDADQIILNDNGTMKQVAVSALNTYTSSSIAADNIASGSSAVTLTTSSGNITIDAAANDSDIILKGTDGGADTTFLTIDGSAAGAATFNAGITATTGTFSGAITSSAGATITTADNTTQLTLTSTDADATVGPRFDLKRDSGSPADGDTLGRIRYLFDNDAAEQTEGVRLDGIILDASDSTEDIQFELSTLMAGTLRSRLKLGTESVFNEASQDIDFRVESNTNTHAIFVEGSSSHIGINTSSPQSDLHVTGSDTSTSVIIENTNADASAAPDLFLFRNSSSPADNDSLGNIEFRGKNDNTEDTRYVINNAKALDVSDGTEDGQIEWQILNAGSFQKVLTMNPTEVVINEDSGSTDFRVESNAEANAFKIDGGSETAAFGVPVTFNDAANVAQEAITSSSNAVAWDATDKPNAYHLTTENTTFSAPSNAVEGAFICVEINYNGSHTIAWNTVFEFAASTAPTATSTDGKTDILVFRYNGAVWQEVGRTLNLSES